VVVLVTAPRETEVLTTMFLPTLRALEVTFTGLVAIISPPFQGSFPPLSETLSQAIRFRLFGALFLYISVAEWRENDAFLCCYKVTQPVSGLASYHYFCGVFYKTRL